MCVKTKVKIKLFPYNLLIDWWTDNVSDEFFEAISINNRNEQLNTFCGGINSILKRL